MNAEYLASQRKQRGISQTRIAMMTGISRWKISEFECGYRQPTPKEATKIRNAIKGAKNVR